MVWPAYESATSEARDDKSMALDRKERMEYKRTLQEADAGTRSAAQYRH